MKIFNNRGVVPGNIYTNQAGDRQKEALRPEGQSPADSLAISGQAARMSELVREAALDEARLEKVSRIKEALASGHYALDSKKIAGAMLRADQE